MVNDKQREMAAGRFYKVGLFCLLIPVLLFSSVQACQPQPKLTQPPDQVKLQLKWLHQAQFAGFYLAQERGYYKDENIDVTFMEGGLDIDIGQYIISGEADFGVVAPELIFMERGQGNSPIAIASIYRRSAVVFLSLKDSGIVRPQDFDGKTVSAADPEGSHKDFEIQFYALMKRLGMDVSKINIVKYDSEYTSFYKGDVEVTPCYYTGGLISMRQKGIKLNLIWPSDYGIHFYSDTLVTTARMIDTNPALVTRFVRASLHGWRDAIEDYQQAVDATMKYARINDIVLQTAMMEAMLPLINTGKDHVGWMKPAEWQGMYDILLTQGLLVKPFNVNEVYTMRFLEEVYGSKIK